MKINSIKLGIVAFLVVLVGSVFLTARKSINVEENVAVTNSKLDSVSHKVDSRYYSYDNLFFQTNSVVVDSTGAVIGEIYIYTNEAEIKEFYSDSTRKKTRYYENLLSDKLKIKIKE
tara:strand:+ start:119 stop:469 length:351 start_codon:yes stop_codon:yes gene_type:complete